MAHKHSLYDTDNHFVIDPYTRNITSQSPAKLILMQFDHNCERFTFEVPRFIDGHDMSLCDRVRIHYINAGSGETYKDVYEVDDLEISLDDENAVICSWLISQNATQIAGTLSFVLHYACHTDGVLDYAWHSNIFSQVKVLSGINNEECIVEQYPDILEQWRQELVDAGILAVESAVKNVVDDINVALIRTKGTLTLDVTKWNGKTQIASNLGKGDYVFFTPATIFDRELATNSGLFVTVLDSVVVFEVEELPETSIDLTYLIIGFETTEHGIEIYDGEVVVGEVNV